MSTTYDHHLCTNSGFIAESLGSIAREPFCTVELVVSVHVPHFLKPSSNTNRCYLKFEMHITVTIISMLHMFHCLTTAAVSMTSLQRIIIALSRSRETGRSSVIRFNEVRETNRIILLKICKTDENIFPLCYISIPLFTGLLFFTFGNYCRSDH